MVEHVASTDEDLDSKIKIELLLLKTVSYWLVLNQLKVCNKHRKLLSTSPLEVVVEIFCPHKETVNQYYGAVFTEYRILFLI